MDTIKELETFIRYPNGTYRKQNDNFYDDRVMALVWGLFVLESEICQQCFQVDEVDEQNKPLKISDNGYYEKDPTLYHIKDLSNNSNVTTLGNDTLTEKYQPLITEEEYDKMSDRADFFDLLGDGWKPIG
jgi:hypothetical protein